MKRNVPPAARAGASVLAVAAVLALMLALFAWTASRDEPHDLPLVVAGPQPQATALAERLEREQPGFDVSTVADAAAADRALRDRRAYGALVVGPSGIELHVASAGSPAVAQLLTGQAGRLGQGRAVPVTDVVPTDPDDRRGGALASGILPLVIASVAAGALLWLLSGSRVVRFTGLAGYAVLAGLVATAILRYGLDALPGHFAANAAAFALLTLAMAAIVTGLGAALGRAGIGLGVLAVFLLGNPLSALTLAPELLPEPWGAFGQALPPGAGGNLVRSVAFFDGHGAASRIWVLAIWAGTGLALVAIGRASAVLPTGAGHRAAREPVGSRAA